MFSSIALPTSLLALIFALPVLASPITPNDPFHQLSIHRLKPVEHPVCCLTPSHVLESQEEEPLLSFEDWKAKRLAEMHRDLASHSPPNLGSIPVNIGVPDTAIDVPSNVAVPVPSIVVEQHLQPEPRLSPQLRIPLHDRFNYASTDCSARVHNTHRGAKSSSSILTSKKDRYMLSPCASPNQFVVVELCDDIRIDTVQLANYEFFSGVFKDFSVSVAKTYVTEPDRWTLAGRYKAKNVRGVQVGPLCYFLVFLISLTRVPIFYAYHPCAHQYTPSSFHPGFIMSL